MNKISKFSHIYLIFIIFIIVISVIGSTYAYLTATTRGNKDVDTSSRGFSLSLNITPVYNDFFLIPMDDSDVIKALNNQCKDKYGRGSCHAYNINVSDFEDTISAISGNMTVNLNNINNLSYMVMEEKEETGDDCVSINSINYCVSYNTEKIIANSELSLGDNYDVVNKESENLLLIIWLSNLDESQNSYDIGDYNAEVVMSLGGNGGKIQGSINGSINNKLQSEE